MEPLGVLLMAHTLLRDLQKEDAPKKGVMGKLGSTSFQEGVLQNNVSRRQTWEAEG